MKNNNVSDLKRILEDPSIIIKQDQKVFELIAKWNPAPCLTLSGKNETYQR